MVRTDTRKQSDRNTLFKTRLDRILNDCSRQRHYEVSLNERWQSVFHQTSDIDLRRHIAVENTTCKSNDTFLEAGGWGTKFAVSEILECLI